jgi:transcriptional activator HAC1
MAVLRLASTEGNSADRVSEDGESAAATAAGESQRQLPRRGPTGWLSGAPLPSKEVLLALAWVLKVEERRLQIREQVKAASKPGTSRVPQTTPTVNKTTTYVLKVSNKRNREEESRVSSSKRSRFH